MKMLARDIMSPDVISVSQDMDLRDLAKLFLEKRITGAPVVDAEDNLVGVVSQTDLIYYDLTRDDELVLPSDFYQHARVEGRHLPQGFQIEDCNTGKVSDVMTPVVHSVTENTSLATIARRMTRSHIHRLIVRKGRKATGIISALDVLKVMGNAVFTQSPKLSSRRAVRSRRARARPRP